MSINVFAFASVRPEPAAGNADNGTLAVAFISGRSLHKEKHIFQRDARKKKSTPEKQPWPGTEFVSRFDPGLDELLVIQDKQYSSGY
jgi:hypothetical protein